MSFTRLRIRCSHRPRFTEIFFNPEKRELRQHFPHSCIPYLICGNLRNRADGISEIEGKAARGRASELGNKRFSIEERDFRDRR